MTELLKTAGDAPQHRTLSGADYLRKILTARVYDVASQSDLVEAPKLSARLGHTILLKREDTQSVFSFKVRGAYNKMAQLTAEELARGVICSSAGNHAQGVALAARKLGCRAVIVMPTTTPEVKVQGVLALGGEAVLFGDSYSDSYQHAVALQKTENLTFVHPFDDPDVIAGQGTVGLEILRQYQRPIDAIFCPVGGGGLIAGVASYVKAVRPEVKVIGVQTTDSRAMLNSVAAGMRVQLKEVGLFCDGTAVRLVGDETYRLVRELVDEFVVVETDAVCAAIKDVYEDTRGILEPSGAMAVAAVKQYAGQAVDLGQTFVAITSGANMNFERLRFVAERAVLGEEREAIFAVTMGEQRGELKKFCSLLGARNVTELNYRMADRADARVLVRLSIAAREEISQMMEIFSMNGYSTLDLTDDELTKEHLRHLVTGPSSQPDDEQLIEFNFPEKPRALSTFLSLLDSKWNISLFHYRNQGADFGRVLVGIQVPHKENERFSSFLLKQPYKFTDYSNNLAYRMFLR
ncbi:threonine ammonia-lyase, biosynthetic [Cupriavidus sp. PET2-C1]